jgi:hypothetical protein
MPGYAYASFAACSWIAAITFGCPCPMFTLMSWLLKSIHRWPSGPYR